MDTAWAWRLPERLDALRLVDVGAEFDGEIYRGGSARALLEPQLAAGRATASARYSTAAGSRSRIPTRWFHGPAKFSVWARRPAAAA